MVGKWKHTEWRYLCLGPTLQYSAKYVRQKERAIFKYKVFVTKEYKSILDNWPFTLFKFSFDSQVSNLILNESNTVIQILNTKWDEWNIKDGGEKPDNLISVNNSSIT